MTPSDDSVSKMDGTGERGLGSDGVKDEDEDVDNDKGEDSEILANMLDAGSGI
jgi:hypothetical protein